MKKRKILSVSIVLMLISVALGATFQSSYAQSDLKQIEAKSLDDYSCDSKEWHFVITQIENASLAPDSISVSWANGFSEEVLLSQFTGGTAHYSTGSGLNSKVTGATATIYGSWSGEFNLSHGPCEVPTPTLTNTATNTLTATNTITETVTNTPTSTITFTATSTGTITMTPTSKYTMTPTEKPKTPTLTVTVTDIPKTPTPEEPPLGGSDPRKSRTVVPFLVGTCLILASGGFLLVRGRKIT